jgi:hypothetical protein
MIFKFFQFQIKNECNENDNTYSDLSYMTIVYLFLLLINKVILYRQYILYLPSYSLISRFIQEKSHQSSKYNVKTFTLVINNDNLDY